MKSLNRILTMYLDYAEDQAERRNLVYMKDWDKKLGAFLEFNDKEILTNSRNISNKVADELASNEYDKYNHDHDHDRLNGPSNDDFDKYIKINKLK